MKIEKIAEMAHEVNRAYCQCLGDYSQPIWDQAPQWQKDSAIEGVKFLQANPSDPVEASHVNWSNQKINDGWKYGPVKNPDTKEHPCLVPFMDLPREQQAKDYIFSSIVYHLSKD